MQRKSKNEKNTLSFLEFPDIRDEEKRCTNTDEQSGDLSYFTNGALLIVGSISTPVHPFYQLNEIQIRTFGKW